MQQNSQTDYHFCIFKQHKEAPDAQIYPYNQSTSVGIGKNAKDNSTIITDDFTTFNYVNP